MGDARPSGRLPKARRVRKRREYRDVQARSERVKTAHFIFLLHANANADGNQARLGITASRKVGNAVVRNRAKRLVREAFRATRWMWPESLDVVVIVRSLNPKLKLEDVVDEWQRVSALITQRARKAFERAQSNRPIHSAGAKPSNNSSL